MNLSHHPDVARFLRQLGQNDSAVLLCPLCGNAVSIEHCQSENRISAICSHCDFHAAVPPCRQ